MARNIWPNIAKNTRVIATLAAVKRRFSKKRTSSIGWSLRSSQATNAPSRPTPMVRLITTVLSLQPLLGASMIPHSTPIRPAIDNAAPTRSRRGASASRDDGSTYQPAMIPTTITGTFTKKIEPQEKCSSRMPPITGPSAPLAPATAAQRPIARARSRGSAKMLVSRERVAGMISAAPMPMNARVKISVLASPAKADAIDPTPKMARPTISAPLRPKRSPRLPIVSRRPANTSV